jgi:hypothetical protein
MANSYLTENTVLPLERLPGQNRVDNKAVFTGELHMKHISTLCRQNSDSAFAFFNPGGAYTNPQSLEE